MKKNTKKASVIAVVAGLLVLCDGFITKFLNLEGSFVWVAFVSWNVFFGATMKERVKAVVGYVIGFLAAVLMIKGGTLLDLILSVPGIAIGSILVTMIINFLCVELENIDKWFPISIAGIFVGMAMTFSGLGIGLTVNTFENSMMMLLIILIYGVLGLLSGWVTLKLSEKKRRLSKAN